ncbi:MAG: fibronectin type III domain-containing protein [Bacteroidetes bacterium]|nr:fibronectin type III domain-containing protein [Bacteroidota bacterium]
MKRYIQKTLDELKAMDAGMLANPADWASTPVKELDVKSEMTKLESAGNDITNAEVTLSEARVKGSGENKVAEKLANQIINIAYGIYASKPEKLAEYGIKQKKIPSKVPVPTKTLAIKIDNDTDGEGFILTLVERDDVADTYEWQKGQGIDPKDISTIPPMSFYKQTSKITFVDDNVLKGIRYFYKVRALNRNGQGPWSEPVSKVQ